METELIKSLVEEAIELSKHYDDPSFIEKELFSDDELPDFETLYRNEREALENFIQSLSELVTHLKQED